MGLEGTATRMIWVVAAISATGSVLAMSFDMLAADHAATTTGPGRLERMESRFDSALFCYDPGLAAIEVRAINEGDPIDLTNVTLLVDGVIAEADSVTVDGIGTTPTWPTGEIARWSVDVPSEPARALLVTPRGAMVPMVEGDCPVLTSAVITPSTATLTAGTQRSFSVQGYDQHGAPISGYVFTWTSDGGTLAPQSDTSAIFTASTNAATGRTVTATAGAVSVSATVDVIPDVPVGVTVTPNLAGVAAGGSATFAATVVDQYGNANSSATVTWTTNAGSITSGGVLTAQTTAQTGRSVTATVNGYAVSGSATVDVVAAAPATVTVAPSSATILTLAQQTFTATVRDAYNNVNSTSTVTWSATTGSITSGGVYTAPGSTGTGTITATASGVQGTSSITIWRNTHVSAMATYNGATPQTVFAKGTTVTTRVTVLDHNNVAVSGALVNIEIRDPSGTLRCNCSGTTDAAGIAAIAYTLPNANLNGQWSDTTTLITLTRTTYTPAANVVTTINFTEA